MILNKERDSLSLYRLKVPSLLIFYIIMATTFRLKRKTFALLSDGSGKSISDFKADYNKAGGLKGTGKSFKEYYRGGSPNTALVGGSAVSQGASGSAIANANKNIATAQANRAAQRAKNIANPGAAAARAGFQRGQASVGIKQGAMNTWNRMGKMGKAGTVAAAVGGTYLLGKGLFGGRKDRRG